MSGLASIRALLAVEYYRLCIVWLDLRARQCSVTAPMYPRYIHKRAKYERNMLKCQRLITTLGM